jgi:RNA polymerase sigma factor (sigma-70 family)
VSTAATELEVPAPDAAPAEVFEYVYARYQRRITYYVYGLVEDWAMAEDVTADMFTRLWRQMSQQGFVIDSPQRAYALLTMRARQTAYHQVKSTYQQREHPVSANEPQRIQALAARLTIDSPESTVISRADLQRVVSILPQSQARVILARYLEDMAPDQIAEITGWPPSTVHFHVNKALSTLRAVPGIAETLGRERAAAPHAVRRVVRGVAPATFAPTLAARDAAAAERRQRTEEMLLERIYTGELAPGSRLPSTRAISTWCGVSSNGACRVLSELTERGVLVQDAAGQYYVTAPDGAMPALRGEQAVERLRAFLTDQVERGALSIGQVVPSRRQLTAAIGFNTNTVTTALRTLAAAGFLAKNTAGRYVLAAQGSAPAPATTAGPYLVTGRTPTGADTFPTAQLAARKAA